MCCENFVYTVYMFQAMGRWMEAAESDFENVFQVMSSSLATVRRQDDRDGGDDSDDSDDTLTLCDEDLASECDVLLETLETDTE